MQCVRATPPKRWNIENFDTDIDNDDDEDLDVTLIVNEYIVDNEFHGRDVSVSLTWPDGKLQTSNPFVSTVRWSAALLCSLQLPSTSFGNLSGKWERRNCGVFGSGLTNLSNNPLESFTLEFDNIVSSYLSHNDEYSTNLNRRDTRMEHTYHILRVRVIGAQNLRSFSSQSLTLYSAFACFQQAADAFELLQNQIGIDEKIAFHSVHWFSLLAMAPPRNYKPNAFILGLFPQCDNFQALHRGFRIPENIEIEGNEHSDPNIIPRCLTLIKSHSDPHYNGGYFIGTSLDSVRTLLANWSLLRSGNHNSSCWRPAAPTNQ